MPITAAVLAGLGTSCRRRRRSLPANVPLTKRRRRQRRPGPSRDLCVMSEGGAITRRSLGAHQPAHRARRFLQPPPCQLGEANRAEAGVGTGKEQIREILQNFSYSELSGGYYIPHPGRPQLQLVAL